MTLLLLHPCCAPDEPILIKNRHNNIFKGCNGFWATTKFTQTVEMNSEKGSPIVEENLSCAHASLNTPERVLGEKILKQHTYIHTCLIIYAFRTECVTRFLKKGIVTCDLQVLDNALTSPEITAGNIMFLQVF